MEVRVRFAPSPTGYLHIGGARTAVYSYLFAKRKGGKLILRIEDTDLARSKREYEESQMKDLKWCGITWDEGPDCPGEYGPYRQSERIDIYKKYAEKLIADGHAYRCFCTEERLTTLKEHQEKNNEAPHYDRACLKLSPSEIENKLKENIPSVVRFKVPEKQYRFIDHVRGEVTWPNDMVGDFVMLRSNDLPTYNYCCVIDDYLMKISHVIRAEEHLNNTLRQLMIYDALKATAPEFAHVSLLIGEDRQKLSKRHGATSVAQYREEHYLPEALMNYLCLLGWSHPEEKDIFTMKEIAPLFDLSRFSKSPALYDIQKLKFFNGEYIKNMPEDQLIKHFLDTIPKESPFHQQDSTWMKKCAHLFRDKIQLIPEIIQKMDLIFGVEAEINDEYNEIKSWESTGPIKNYLLEKVNHVKTPFVSLEEFNAWADGLKKDLGIKGKFLFKGLRSVLTLKADGPDLKALIELTPTSILKERVLKF